MMMNAEELPQACSVRGGKDKVYVLCHLTFHYCYWCTSELFLAFCMKISPAKNK